MGLGERLDRFISVIAPKWAADRTAARFRIEHIDHRRALATTYAAAERNRLSFDWGAKPTSADSALTGDFDTINARARAAVRDDWAANSTVSAYRRHVIGTGITCRSAARDPQTGEAFDDFNKAADVIWNRWCRAKWCDIERRKSFVEIQGMIASEFATVGQGFVIIHADDSRDAIPGTMLQVFEPEMLDMIRHQNPDNGNFIRHGVEIDTYGAPVAYWVYVNHHPLDSSMIGNFSLQSTRIPADRVCHVMRQDRPRQTFGVSRLSPILKKLQHLKMYDEYQMVAARMEACYGGAIEQDPNIAPANWGTDRAPGDSATDANGNTYLEFEPGMFKRLAPGEKVSWHDPKRPGELYAPFVKAQTNHIAAGVGLDSPTITRDFSGNTFSGQRQGMLERDYETDPLQWLIVDMLCCPVRDDVITSAVMQGILKAPGMFQKPELMEAYLCASWRPQAKPWIDPANQAAAAQTMLNMRLANLRNLYNEQGEDYVEELKQFADEQDYMDSLGITPEPPTPPAKVTN